MRPEEFLEILRAMICEEFVAQTDLTEDGILVRLIGGNKLKLTVSVAD